MSAAEKIIATVAATEIHAEPFIQIPHLFFDRKGNLASCFAAHKVAQLPRFEVRNGSGILLGSVQIREDELKYFQAQFSVMSEDLLELHNRNADQLEQILDRDLAGLFEYCTSEKFEVEPFLLLACKYLRSNVLAENCSVFGLPDEQSLCGLAAISPYGTKTRKDEWNYSAMNIASLVIEQKRPYLCENTDQDANYSQSKNSQPRNLVCFPIMNKGKVIGVINISNKLSGSFGDSDVLIVQRFATLLAHVLKQEFDLSKNEKAEHVAQNLGKYLSKNLVQKIDSTGTAGDLGGITKKVVVLFSDIRSFTSISEGLAPPILVKLLNLYFEEMGQVVEKFNGTIDKLVGDLMMVVWNIPADQPDPEVLAIKAAIEMQKTFKRKVLPKWQANGIPNIGIGIGINSGPAVVGNLGSSHFMNYTVIGPSINLAQRLESKAKAGEIWVHESIMPLVEGKVPKPVRKEVNIRLKGVAVTVNAFVFMETQF